MDKKIFVTQPSIPPLNEFVDEIKSIFETKWLTNMGNKHLEFEEKLKKYLNVSNVTLFTNGHMALYTAIQYFNFPRGSEIITTPYSFSSTTHAIVQNGLKPVFCDINEKKFTIDEKKIESLITNNTVAILPVHVYGNICNVEKIEEIAQKYNLKVIYDAAHAFGVKYKTESICNYGDISMLSFHATKVFNSIEGGALIYKDNIEKEKLEQLKNFGIADYDSVNFVGMNAKMNEFCAAMGLCNLRYIDSEIKKREKIFIEYFNRLCNIDGLQILKFNKNIVPNYSYFPIVVDKKIFGKCREEIIHELEKENIFPRKYFYPLISEYKCYFDKYSSEKTPIAKNISDNVLTLPMYADLTINEVRDICNIILKK